MENIENIENEEVSKFPVVEILEVKSNSNSDTDNEEVRRHLLQLGKSMQLQNEMEVIFL